MKNIQWLHIHAAHTQHTHIGVQVMCLLVHVAEYYRCAVRTSMINWSAENLNVTYFLQTIIMNHWMTNKINACCFITISHKHSHDH